MEDLVAERNRLAGDVGHSARVNEQHGGLSDRATINTSAVAAEASAIPLFRFPVRRPISTPRPFNASAVLPATRIFNADIAPSISQYPL
ncbi:hypothetical protein BDFB_012112 [Asbolus verrucosus]|uniref:Uncharacterized protein n=1 Tax=Asbolus verrucosus TaxID=1661398 RepID=A0A482VUB6_ASBVE|nr:hypothetical protein BDFB_012112 [Asbolus verrucosus]